MMNNSKQAQHPHENKGEVLLAIARAAISKALGESVNKPYVNYPWLKEKGATFVTLTKNQTLRGCIGSIEAYRSLLLDVESNALAAAFRDPRFPPLALDELNSVMIEVSLLSKLQPIHFISEQDALSQLQSGIDGVLFEYKTYRSTFLPQVWDQLPEPSDFMSHLKQKAGLAPDFWDDEIKLSRYGVSKWKENRVSMVSD
jgi:AmmeMemoRadiSam system protein A